MIEKVFYNLSNIPNFNCDWIEDQLLLYIYDKSGIGKSRVISAIKLKYTFLLRDFDFVIIALIGARANNISNSIIHINFAIGIKNKYIKSNAISNL